jgi:hypothetical protein
MMGSIIPVLPEYPAKLRQWGPGVVPVSPLGFPDKAMARRLAGACQWCRGLSGGRCETRRPCARAPCARPNPGTVTRESPQPSPGGAARAAHAPVASDSPASQSESQAPRDRGPRPIPRQKGPEDRRPLQGPSAFAQGSCTVPGCTTTYFNNYSWARR